jgi:ABC-type glycerol-3-phosphate transport system substrate-binding protein
MVRINLAATCRADCPGDAATMIRALLLAVALAYVPPSAQAADLVTWWEKGFHPDEDQAVRETIAAFERKTGKEVQLALYTIGELPGSTLAVEAGRPPDLV